MNVFTAISAIGSGLVQGTINMFTTVGLTLFALVGLCFFFTFKHIALWLFYAATGNAMLPIIPWERSNYLWEHTSISAVRAGFDPLEEETSVAVMGTNTSGVNVQVLAVCTINSTMGGSSKQSWWAVLPAGAENAVVYGGTGSTSYTGPISSQHCTIDEISTSGGWWRPKKQV